MSFSFSKESNPGLIFLDTESKAGTMSGGSVLPWGAHKERSPYPSTVNIDVDIKPGEFVMRTLFADFTVQAERKMEAVMNEPLVCFMILLESLSAPSWQCSCLGSLLELLTLVS